MNWIDSTVSQKANSHFNKTVNNLSYFCESSVSKFDCLLDEQYLRIITVRINSEWVKLFINCLFKFGIIGEMWNQFWTFFLKQIVIVYIIRTLPLDNKSNQYHAFNLHDLNIVSKMHYYLFNIDRTTTCSFIIIVNFKSSYLLSH